MAAPTFFGEVLPLVSRAVDDEEDEQDAVVEAFRTSVLRWAPSVRKEIEVNGHIDCSTFIIALGPVATAFCQTHFLHQTSEVIGVVCCGMDDSTANTFSQTASSDKVCYVHRLVDTPRVLICQCNVAVMPEQAHSWVSQVFSGIHRREVYVAVLCSMPVNEFKSSECPSSELPTPFLRFLKSSSCHSGASIIPYLEQPNIVDGLAAQVMTFCHVHSVPAVMYTCYTENMQLDIASIKEFARLCGQSPFRDAYKANPNASEQLKKIVEQSANRNTLYM